MLLGRERFFGNYKKLPKKIKEYSPLVHSLWMCENYIATISIGVRSFTDQSKNSRSLWRMLYEILENPGVLDRESHARMYFSNPFGISFGRQCFNDVVGKDVQLLPQQVIRSDLRRLEDTSERVRRFVNKRIAHRTKRGELRRPPKFNELDAAIDNLDKTLCKYNFLLTGQSGESFHATRQYNWQEVLWEHWIPKGSKLHPDT